MEIKQHVFEQQMGLRRNLKGNWKVSWKNKNENTTYQKLMGCSQFNTKMEADHITTYFKNEENFQINDLTTPLETRKRKTN